MSHREVRVQNPRPDPSKKHGREMQQPCSEYAAIPEDTFEDEDEPTEYDTDTDAELVSTNSPTESHPSNRGVSSRRCTAGEAFPGKRVLAMSCVALVFCGVLLHQKSPIADSIAQRTAPSRFRTRLAGRDVDLSQENMVRNAANGGSQQSMQNTSEPVRIRWMKNSTKCMDIGGTQAGANLQLWDCDPDYPYNQKFLVPLEGSAGYIQWAKYPYLCLDRPGSGALQFWDCNEAPKRNTLFHFPRSGSGHVRWAAFPNLCLGVIGEGNAFIENGHKLGLVSCTSLDSGGDGAGVFIREDKACQWEEWSSWSQCSATCAGGTQHRSRQRAFDLFPIDDEPCGGDASEETICNTERCPTGDECGWSDWSAWSNCSKTCGRGERKRSRTLLKHVRHGAKRCSNATVDFTGCASPDCPKPPMQDVGNKTIQDVPSSMTSANRTSNRTKRVVECEWQGWSLWEKCTVTCGFGKQTRTRKVKRLPQYGGKACGNLSQEFSVCKREPCQSNSTDNSSVGNISDMDISNMVGGSLLKTDCQWAAWSVWSVCSLSCGGGVRSRTRHVKTWPDNGGRDCGIRHAQSEPCNGQACFLSQINSVLGQLSSLFHS